jgi:hypothetical protein
VKKDLPVGRSKMTKEEIIAELRKEGWVAPEEVGQQIKDIMFYSYGIEKVCPDCGGTGKKAYGNTSTWRHGIGGQAITSDICDNCWGSGDLQHKWLNLRHLNNILTTDQINKLRKLSEL